MFLGTYRLYRTDNAEAPSAGDVTWKPISGDLTSGCTGAAPNGARGCLISRGRRRRRRRRRLRRHRRRRVWSARTRPRQRQPDLDPGRQATPARTGRSTRFAVDRSNWRIAYVAYGGFGAATPSKPRPRLRAPPTAARPGRTSPATCPTSRSTRSSSTRRPEHALRRHRRRRLRDLPTAARTGSALGDGHPEGRRLAARLRRHQPACSPPAPTAAAPTPCRTATPRRRSSSPRPTPASRSARAAHIDYTITRQEHRQRRRDRRHHHRPVPANTTLRLRRQRRHGVRRASSRGPA